MGKARRQFLFDSIEDLLATIPSRRVSALDIPRKDLPENSVDDVNADEDRAEEKQDQKADDDEDEGVVGAGALPAGGPRADEVHILPVRFPEEIESIAEERDHPDNVVEPDIERHSEQCDLRHAIADAGEQDIERREGRDGVSDVRHKPDQRIKPEPPGREGNAKKPVKIMREIVEPFFDLKFAALLFRKVEPGSRCRVVHSSIFSIFALNCARRKKNVGKNAKIPQKHLRACV